MLLLIFRRKLLLATCLIALLPLNALAQVLLDENFSAFDGSGFTPMPAPGQLDSDTWIVQGLSDAASTAFGDVLTSSDFTGSSTGGVGAGGIYAFDTDSNTILGVQPTGDDFTPGSFDLRVFNTSGAVAEAIAVSYTIWVLNNATRSSSINLEFSSDGEIWTPVPDLDFSTPEASDASAAWVSVDRSLTLTGLTIAEAAPFFLRWDSQEVSGSGSRDEFGIDDVLVEVVPPPDLIVEKTGPAFALAGDQLIYQIQIDNFSTSESIIGLTVTDTLPADISYLSDDSGVIPTNTAGVLEWDFGDLAAGDGIAFELVVDLGVAAAAGERVNSLSAQGQVAGQAVTSDSDWTTLVVDDVSIFDIQAVSDPANDDASPLIGQTVSVDGIVTAAPGELDGAAIAVIQESVGGPFSGLTLNGDFSALTLNRGDQIRVIGQVGENFDLTRLNVDLVEFVQSGTVLAPQPLTTSSFAPQDPADSEQWESVLIEFSLVDVTDDTLGFGEWLFDDGSGEAQGDDISPSLSVVPAVGDSYSFLRGIGWFSFGNYKVQPRDNNDFGFIAEVFSLSEIQGNGLRSPFAPTSGSDPGAVVRTEGNIVTAVGADFFVIQTPDLLVPRGAVEPAASRGLQVFTGSVPSVSVGDEVTVQGAVVEFFDLTQIGNPDVVEIVSSGNPLPSPVQFNEFLPSPDPASPSCGVNNFECFESMRVAVSDGFVTAPSQSFGSDPVAEAVVSANGRRTLRGAGVEFPGITDTCLNCPVWSGAPERFELDLDRFLVSNPVLAGGTTFSATGVIGFSFGDYALWPTEVAAISIPDLPSQAPTGSVDALRVASLNALDLFDTVQNGPRAIPACDAGYIAEDREVLTPAQYELKLDKLAGTLINALQLPDVIAFQEVESLQTLQALADRVALLTTDAVIYTPYLEFGNDRGNINNGFLINQARVAVDAVVQEGLDECLSEDNTPLHDRPTLTLEARFIANGADWPFVVMNNHFRSLSNVDSSSRTRLKRHEQAQTVAARLQARQQADTNLPIILVGDKNAFQFTDGYVDLIGLLSGSSVEDQNLVNIENAGVPGFDPSNQVSPGLVNALDTLPEEQRYSFIFRGVAQTLDHALLNRAANRFLSDFGYMRGNADAWVGFGSDENSSARSSDHDGFVLVLEPGRDVDGLFRDRFEVQP